MESSKPWVHLLSQEKYDITEIAAKVRPVFVQENVNVFNKTVVSRFPSSSQ